VDSVRKLKSLLFKSLIKALHIKWLYFQYINWKWNLNLDYTNNKSEIHILKEVFSGGYQIEFPNNSIATIVDIGAHYGYFSMYASKNLSPGSKVFAIEPSQSNFERLQENINASCLKNIHVSNVAIGNVNTVRKIFTSKPQNHSLYEHYIDGMLEGRNVACITLANFCEKNGISTIDFLKIDCEGAEHEIIQSFGSQILNKIKIISLEIHDMSHYGFDNDLTLNKLIDCGFEIVVSDYPEKKFRKGFNAKVVLKSKNIS
jgi:FkbM family methyltransferase